MIANPSSPIIQELIAAGIIPPMCHSWRLIVDVGEPVKAISEVFVTEEQLRTIADLLLKHKGYLDEIVTYKSMERGEEDPGITAKAGEVPA